MAIFAGRAMTRTDAGKILSDVLSLVGSVDSALRPAFKVVF